MPLILTKDIHQPPFQQSLTISNAQTASNLLKIRKLFSTYIWCQTSHSQIVDFTQILCLWMLNKVLILSVKFSCRLWTPLMFQGRCNSISSTRVFLITRWTPIPDYLSFFSRCLSSSLDYSVSPIRVIEIGIQSAPDRKCSSWNVLREGKGSSWIKISEVLFCSDCALENWV